MRKNREGGDPKRQDVSVTPAQHYTMGGIEVDMQGRTSMQHLYAIGEAACTGVHGKNRLASNSLPKCAVLGRRAAAALAQSKLPDIEEDEEAESKWRRIDEEAQYLPIMERIEKDELEKTE